MQRSEYDIPLSALYNGWGFARYVTAKEIKVQVPSTGEIIVIPEGFPTDGRTSGIFGFFIPRWGRSGRASLVHDFLYRQRRNRKEADDIFLELMEFFNPSNKVTSYNVTMSLKYSYWPKIENYLSYYYVRSLGWILYLKK